MLDSGVPSHGDDGGHASDDSGLSVDDVQVGEPGDNGEEPIDILPAAQTALTDEENPIPERLPILPIRESAVFPGVVMPLAVSREKSKHVLDLALAGSRMIGVVAQRVADVKDPKLDDLYRVGTACTILKMLKREDGSDAIIVHGVRRIGLETLTHDTDYLEARVHAFQDPTDVSTEQQALVHTIRASARRIIELTVTPPEGAAEVLNSIETPGLLADFLAANLPLRLIYKQELLETFDVTERLRKVHKAVVAHLDVLELSKKIQTQVQDQVDKTQREYYLREQMKAIQKELGDVDSASAAAALMRERIAGAGLPEPVQQEADRELQRMERIPQASPEYSMALDYLEWLAELPWSNSTEDSLDIAQAERILDEDHYGLARVKKRILEFLAVRTLKRDSHGPILCFAGPPGVGKTSLGQSIARAMGRRFIRVSLGGIHDESTIRGHRRTYIGSMPGRIIREIRRAGSNNPLFMLDEVDKITQDVHGDPMSALLEVLDPAQNATFSDHYLGVPFDLSKVFFIATANYMAAIEPALRDRMEIIELSSYTHEEKLMIARRHLIPRQVVENGLTLESLSFPDEPLSTLIGDYTREAGVRSLERKIGSVCRARAAARVRGEVRDTAVSIPEIRAILGPKEFEAEIAATKAVPGVVTGLAYTPTGGEILFVEASLMPGTGQLRLTGQLGDVMRESALAAGTIVRTHLRQWHIKPDVYRTTDLHIHVPAGAVPKDGPSAGVAMLTALVSALTGRTVDPSVGMTGEITLSGRVLPIGGVTEKVLAAHRAGLTRVILPARNEADLTEVPQEVRRNIDFLFVNNIDELLDRAFGRRSKGRKRSKLERGGTEASPKQRRTTQQKSGETLGKKKLKAESTSARKPKKGKRRGARAAMPRGKRN